MASACRDAKSCVSREINAATAVTIPTPIYCPSLRLTIRSVQTISGTVILPYTHSLHITTYISSCKFVYNAL